jgi:serine/threonine-protein kinase HipA
MSSNYNEIEVYLYGEKVGTLLNDGKVIVFYYSPRFKAKNIEISPIKLNTNKTVRYTNEEYPEIYEMLPGVIRDSLPDSNGQKVMDKYFIVKGLNPNSINALHRLAFIGDRGMGALEYKPKEHENEVISQDIIDASELYLYNKSLHSKNTDIVLSDIMAYLIDSASPVGGAKEKVLIDFNEETRKLRFHDENSLDLGYKQYLMKFDKEEEFKEDTKKEYIYMSLAKECGIEVMNFTLLQDGDMMHYLIERFDRVGKEKFHLATASALLHRPHMKNGITYEELANLTYEITGSRNEVKKLIRQMIFNIILAVTDDHAKNFSFLMDKNGKWRLSPAYDLIYGLGAGALKHKTSLNGKNDKFFYSDILQLTEKFYIDEKEVEDMVVTTIEVFRKKFKELSDEVGLLSMTKSGIEININERIENIAS